MVGIYTYELFRRVFSPTTKGADILSTMVPLLIALYAVFRGVTVSTDAGLQVSAYVGAIVLAIFLLRLLFVAPYAMWRDKVGEVAGLKLELTKPEQIELRRMGRIRAKKRVRLAALIRELQWQAFVVMEQPNWENRVKRLISKGVRLLGEVAPTPVLAQGFTDFVAGVGAIEKEVKAGRHPPMEEWDPTLARLAADMIEHLHGRQSAMELALSVARHKERRNAKPAK